MKNDTFLTRKTLIAPCTFESLGLHTGLPSQIKVLPSENGLVFSCENQSIPALVSEVDSTLFATRLGKNKAQVQTVEHLLAALYGLGITDARIDVQGEEIPVLDGSAIEFVKSFTKAGIKTLNSPHSVYKLHLPLEIKTDQAWSKLEPAEQLDIEYILDFPEWGERSFQYTHSPDTFLKEIAPARTFSFERFLPDLKSMGLIQGGTLENALLFNSEGKPINSPRFDDEPLRHKVLDLLGDLSLLGQFLQAKITVYKGGHAMHVKMVSELLYRQSELNSHVTCSKD